MARTLALVLLGGTLAATDASAERPGQVVAPGQPRTGTTKAPDGEKADDRPSAGTILASESGWVEFLPDAPPAGTTLHLKEGWIRVESVPEGEEPGGGSFGVISAEVLARNTGGAPADVRPQAGGPRGVGEDGEVHREASRQGPAREARGQVAAPTWADEPSSDMGPGGEPGGWGTSDVYPAGPAVGPCYEEQEAYTKELFRIAGIDSFDHSLALLQILGETPGLSPWVRFNLFGAPFLGPTNGVSWIDPVRPIAWDEGLRWAAKDLTACVRRELGFDDRLVDPDTGE